MPEVAAMLNNPQLDGLKAAVIVGESPDHAPATQRYCQQYAERYGLPLDSVFLDHSNGRAYATIFENMWPYVGPDGRFGLPFNALINAETFEYIYADRGQAGVSVKRSRACFGKGPLLTAPASIVSRASTAPWLRRAQQNQTPRLESLHGVFTRSQSPHALNAISPEAGYFKPTDNE